MIDVGFASIALAFALPAIAIAVLLVRITTGDPGFFRQVRVGLGGCCFTIVKIRTMRCGTQQPGAVTVAADPRISPIGRLLRRTKIDELPQLWNVLVGEMSLVGPRPDVPERIAKLRGKDRAVLSVRPGITGPATLRYRKEELLLQGFSNPTVVDELVIYPDKIRLNVAYIQHYTLRKDLFYIMCTAFGLGSQASSEELQDLARAAGVEIAGVGKSGTADVAA